MEPAVANNLIWLVVGAVIAIIVEAIIRLGWDRLVRDPVARGWKRLFEFDYSDDPYVHALVFSRAPVEKTITVENCGRATYQEFFLMFGVADPNAVSPYSPSLKLHASSIVPGERLTWPWAEAGVDGRFFEAPTIDLGTRWAARMVPLKVLPRLLGRSHDAWGYVANEAFYDSNSLQRYLLNEIQFLHEIAHSHVPDSVSTAILGLSDDRARQILRTKRSYSDPLPGLK